MNHEDEPGPPPTQETSPPQPPTITMRRRTSPFVKDKIVCGPRRTPQAPHGIRAVVYGDPKVGKTTFGYQMPGPIAVYDIDRTMPDLKGTIVPAGIVPGRDVVAMEREDGLPHTWETLIDCISTVDHGWAKSVLIDSATTLEQLIKAAIPSERPVDADGGKAKLFVDHRFIAWELVHAKWTELLNALNAHAEAGRHVCILAHVETTEATNAMGSNFIRYEPLISNGTRGRSSPRGTVIAWAHSIGYMRSVLDIDKSKVKNKSRGSTYLELESTGAFIAGTRNDSIPATIEVPLPPEARELWLQLIGG